MGGGKITVVAHNARGSFADRDQIENNCLLSASVVEEVGLNDAFDIFACQPCRFQHMREVVGESQTRFVVSHTGTASRNTRSRARCGRSPGVKRSTGTPSSS